MECKLLNPVMVMTRGGLFYSQGCSCGRKFFGYTETNSGFKLLMENIEEKVIQHMEEVE